MFQNNSDNQIIQQKSLEELTMWISHLNYISEEMDNLIQISSNTLNEIELSEQLSVTVKNNTNVLNQVLSYKKATDNIVECIDLECDLFYHTEYQKIRELYKNHLETYRDLKRKLFSSLLNDD